MQMRCAICGNEIQGQPSHCPHCGTQLYYAPGAGEQSQTQQAAPQGPWQGASPQPPQPLYPMYGGYPGSAEGQAPPPGYGPAYPQQAPSGPAYGAGAPPSMPMPSGTYPPPGPPYGGYAPPSVPLGTTPGYQAPYPPGYGQPYAPYGAPPTTPFAPAPAARKRRANAAVVVLSIICALVVIAAAGAGVLYLTRHSSPTVGTGTTGAATATATNTPGPAVLYQNALTTPDPAWQQDQNCFFRSDGYHIVGFNICFAPIADQQNTDIKVDMTVLNGDQGAPHGIVFRHNSNPDRYAFDLDSYGDWVFFKCIAAQNKCVSVVDYRPNSAIHQGLHATNTLEVIAVGSHFTFKVNGTEVGAADDSSLSVGAVGFEGHDNSEVVFSNLTITQPQ